MADVITDFQQGTDKIDLSDIDADTTASKDQAFKFVATENTGTIANSITWSHDHINNDTIIHIDNNGDSTADMQIILDGLIDPVSGDFNL